MKTSHAWRPLMWATIASLAMACASSEVARGKSSGEAGVSVPSMAFCEPCAKPMVAAGFRQSLAVKRDGNVWAWGLIGKGDSDGELPFFQAGQVLEFQGAVAVAAGKNHALALKSDGTVWGWGDNRYGQLGDGTTDGSFYPTQAWELTDVVAVAAGGLHSLAVKRDGTVWAWGYNGDGQLGEGPLPEGPEAEEQLSWRHGFRQRDRPVQVPELTGVIAVAARDDHTVVLKRDGTVWAWGENAYGQLGDGSTDARSHPVQVPELT